MSDIEAQVPNRADWKWAALGLLVAAIFFLGDLFVPLGVAGGVPYIAVILLAQRVSNSRFIFAAATFTTILTLIGYLLSPEGGVLWMVLTNRALAISVIWVTAVLLYTRKLADERLIVQKIQSQSQMNEAEKEGKKALSESEERFSALFQNAPLAYQSLDQNGNFIEVNDTWCEMLGYTREEVIGMNFSDIIAPDFISLYLYQFPCFKIDGEIRDVEFKLVRKDDTLIHVSYDGKIGENIDGTFKQTHCMFSDITERKQTEQALLRREHELRSITDNLPALVSYMDSNGRYQFVNEAYEKMFGLPREEIIGRSLEEFLPEKDYAKVKKSIELALTGEHVTSEERIFVGRELRWMAGNFIPDFGDDGEFRGFFAMIRDVSERKRMEEEKSDLEARLQEGEKMEAIGRLAGGIAHDFNNILTGILNYTELAQAEASSGTQQHSDLDQVLRASERAKEVIDQILAFSRDSSKELVCIQWHNIIDEALELLRPSVPPTIELRSRVNLESSPIMGDPTQLHEATMNLCTNALSAIGDRQGTVEVELDQIEITSEDTAAFPELDPGVYYRLIVSDTGRGIAPEVIDRVFEPFFTTHEVGMGTGMGLALVHSIVLGHNGAVRLESTPGEGTSISLYMRHADSTPESSEAQPDNKPESIEGTEKILFVDDEDMIVNSMARALTKLGYEVIGLTSSFEALELFQESPDAFDLVITDLTMPKMTGDVLASEIVNLRPDTPIILCSGYIEDTDEKEAEVGGISRKLKKPLSAKLLGQTVRAVFDERKAGAA